MFLVRVVAACAALTLSAAAAGAGAVSPTRAPALNRLQIQSMLIEAGYSAVATLNLVHSRWIGVGAHDGMVVDFTIDASTGRLISEVKAP